MRILLTGGTGFVGLPIIKKLLESDDSIQILALTRNPEKSLPLTENIKWLEANLNDLGPVSSNIKDFQPEIVIHLAWQDIPDFGALASVNNLNQSINFFQLIWQVKSCKKILIPGSCFEYNRRKGICKEADIVKPKDFFTWSKLALLSYLQLETKTRDITLGWFRLFYVYGTNQRKNSLVPTVIDSLSNRRIPSLRTPKNSNDFIFVEDVADFFVSSIFKEFPSGIYNLGSGIATPVIDICRMIERVISGEITLSNKLEEATIHSSADIEFFASTELTKQVFDWQPKTSLEEGVLSVLNQL